VLESLGAVYDFDAQAKERRLTQQERVRFAAPNTGAPLPAPRRSGQTTLRRAAPAGKLRGLTGQQKTK
jgi:hypothetical protein